MEAGVLGAPMVPAVVHVVEEHNGKVDPAPVHGLNMVVETAQDQNITVPAVTQIHVQEMEAGATGAPGAPVVVHVVEEQKLNIDPVLIHRLKMVVKTAMDHPHLVLPVTQTHVQIIVPMVQIHSGVAGDSGEAMIHGEAGGPDFIRNKVRNMNNIV